MTKKLIFSTKETLKWGFIVGIVALLLPLCIFGADNYQCGTNTYTDYMDFGYNEEWIKMCFNEGDLNIANATSTIQNKSFGFLYLKTAHDYELEITKQNPNPLLALRWCFDPEGTNCQAWTYWNNYYLNNFESWLQTLDIFYSTQSIKNATGTIIYTSEFLEIELRVWGVSPENESTVTTTTADFIVGWEGWDLDWVNTEFVFSFYQENTGIWAGTKNYTPTTEAGATTFKFSDFDFDKNGTYRFHAIAREYPWLIPYRDLVSPEYQITINIEGWDWLFEMPVYEEWYGEHSKFATPTAIFSGVAGFLSPVYNKIGEFGERVVDFLNLDEAYERGYNLGKIIPTFRHYVSQIEVFFGGFPIIQIFLAFLVILLGIFIVRLILKFIPGLG